MRPREPGDRPMLIGPHVSVAGELANAIANGERVGATCIQIFTRNQRTWEAKPLAEEEVARFRSAWEGSRIEAVMSHGSYLVNLGSPEPDKLARSRRAFRAEAARCARLGIRLLNVHPGAHMNGGYAACLARIAESVRRMLAGPESGEVICVLENTAGQGTTVGHRLEDLAELLEKVDRPERTGVCLDTCHLFAAGYDIVSEEGWDAFWHAFESRIGLRYLKALHVNDAKAPLGSRKDRHEALGRGEMGTAFFRRLATDRRFADIPMFLETPGGDPVWKREIALMRRFRRAS